MPNVQDLIPAPSQSARPSKPTSLGGLVADAVSVNWPELSVFRQFKRDAASHDPWWELDEQKLERLGAGLPTAYLPELGEAESEAEALIIRDQLLSLHQSRQELSQAGTTGTILQAAASIVSPVQVGLALSTGGTGTAARLTWSGRALAAAQTGLAVGLPNAAMESVRASVDPEVGTLDVLTAGASGFGFGAAADLTRNAGRGVRFLAAGAGQAAPGVAIDSVRDDRTASDVIYAGTLSFLIGGAMNAVHRTPAEIDAAVTLKRSIEKDAIDDAGMSLTPKGEAYFAKAVEQQGDAGLARRIELSEINDPTPPDATMTTHELRSVADVISPEPAPSVSYGIANLPAGELRIGSAVSSDETAAVPPASRPDRRWTKTEIEQKLIDRYRELNQTSGEARADQEFDTGSFTTTFYKKIPSEIKDQFTPAEVARMFRVSDNRKLATAEDVARDMGWDQYMAEVRRREAGRSAVIGDAKKFFRDNAIDPELEFLSTLHDQLPKGKLKDMETVVPTDLVPGSEFTIKGEKFRVEVEGEGDSSVLVVRDGEKYPTVPVAALDTIPVDRGSISEGKGSPEPYRGEFKPTPGQQRGLLGEQYDGGITGEQTSLGFSRPSEFADEAAKRPAPHASEANADKLFSTAEHMAEDPTYPGPQSIITLSDEAFNAAIDGFNNFGDAPADPSSGPKQPWQMTKSEFVSQRIKPNGNVPDPSVERLQKWLRSPRGEPGIRIEPSVMLGEDITGSPMVVMRGDDGMPVGILSIFLKEDTKTVDFVNVAVRTDMQRRGIGRALYKFAQSNGYNVEAASGVEGLTEAGAGFRHRRAVMDAVEQGKPVPPSVLADYPDLAATARPSQPPIVGLGAASQAAMQAGLYLKASNRYPSKPGDFNAAVHTDTRAFNKRIGRAAGKAGVWLRNSISGLNGQSESSMVRRLTAQLVEDPLAKADGSPSRQSASEWARRNYEVDLTGFLRENRTNFEAWAKDSSVSSYVTRPLARSRLLAEFNEHVGRAVRRETGTYTNDPHINKSADLWRDRIEKLWYLQNRHGVAGFDQIQPYHNYLTRLWSLTKLNAAINEHGEQLVVDLIAEAMGNRMGLSSSETAPYAKGMLRNILEARLGTDLDRAKLFDLPDVGAIREVLKRTVGTITDDQIDSFLFETVKNPKTGLPERARRRVSLDETHSTAGLFSKRALSIEDLLENDVEKLYSRYSHDAHGQSAVASVIESHRTSPTDDLSGYKQLLDRVRRDAAAAYGVRTKDQMVKVNAEVLRLEAAFKSILGHRLGSDSRLAEAGKLLRSYNYLRVMGRAGLNEMQDFVGAIGETGFGTMLRSMPALANIVKQGQSGKISDPLLREIEAFWAAGTDHFRGSVAHYLDPDAQIHVFGEHFDNVAREGGRVMNVANLMAPVSSFNQRAILVAAEQKWLDIARSGKLPSAARLADMGLTAAEAQSIVGQMNQHATSKPGLFGRQIIAANLDQWEPEVRASYIAAMDRFSRSAVVRTDIGQMSRWMTTDLGKTIIQFRTYNITAYEKNLLRNGRARDYQTFRTWAMNTLAGGLFYTAVEYINSLGRADASEYREKRLAPDMIARGAFQRAGYSTFLPGMIDSAIAPFGTALFDTRTSGLSSGLVRGIPTVDAIENAFAAARGVARPVRTDYQFSQGDFRGIRRTIPFQNALIVKNVLDAIETRLPEEARVSP